MDYLKIVLGCIATVVTATAFAAPDATTASRPSPAQTPAAPPAVAGESRTAPAAAPSVKKATGSSTTSTKKPAPAKAVKKVDINNASLADLRALPLGEAEAQKVIAHRPYRAKGELMTRAGLPEGVYFTVKDKVELQEPRKATAAKK